MLEAKQAMEFEVTVTGLGYGGEAVGRLPDGRAVFVPYALPGERVRVRLEEERGRYARAALCEVIDPSPQRMMPRCLHFGECGGCHYQHMSYAGQMEAKADIVRDQLVRIGGLKEPEVLATVPAPQEFNYRNHVQFHLTPRGDLGFHRPEKGSHHPGAEILPIQECHLPEAALNRVWPQLDLEAIPGLERIGLRLGAGEDIQLILEGSDILPPALTVEELPVSAVHLGSAGRLVLAGSESVRMDVLGRSFRVSAEAFFQVNTEMAGKMVEHLLETMQGYCRLDGSSLVVDAYCGVGLFSAFLRPLAGRVIGIESSPEACEDYAVNLDEFEDVELYEAPVEMVLPALKGKPELVVVDPPRAGLGKGVVDGLLKMRPPTLAYISCDPATLARDARRLVEGGYQLEQVTPFDTFPQTYHIESISWWVKM